MKLIFIIQAMLLLLLNGLPCGDTHQAGAVVHAQVHNSTAAHPQEEDGQDRCSPFCTCACCSIANYITEPYSLPATLLMPDARPSGRYITPGLPTYITAFWQPPRFC
jgi:hypothetical protein